ncbi:hypothetical protein ACVWZP_004088 [Pseudomonas sp. TE36184]
MEYDQEAMAAKRKQLEDFVKLAFDGHGESYSQVAIRALDAFTMLSPPVESEQYIQYIAVGSSRGSGGSSRKPGNLLLNWKKLMDIIPDISIASAGVAGSQTWLAALIGLYVWNKVWRGAEEPLSDIEATTILALWKSKDARRRISEEMGLEKTNEWRQILSLPPLTTDQYREVINRLLKMQCIKMDNGIIWLCEWVKVGYR